MSCTTIGRGSELLGCVSEDAGNAEHTFELRTGVRLRAVIAEHYDAACDALADRGLGEQGRADLQELGYAG